MRFTTKEERMLNPLTYTGGLSGEQHYNEIEFQESIDSWAVTFKNSFGGQLYTGFPISNHEYRQKDPTKTKLISHITTGDIHTFHFNDDWGNTFALQIDGVKQPEELRKFLAKIETLPKGLFIGNSFRQFRVFKEDGKSEIVQLEQVRKGDRFQVIPASQADYLIDTNQMYEAMSDPRIYTWDENLNTLPCKPV